MIKNRKTISSSLAEALRGAALVALTVLVACGPPQPNTPQGFLEAGDAAMEDEIYNIAIDNYEKLLEEFPFSEYTEEAQLKIAEAMYREKRYPEAIAAYENFQRMHPTNASMPLTELRIGLAYHEQMGRPDRDQSAAENAHLHFRRVMERYPDTPQAEKAKEKLDECRTALAEHELQVGQFYIHWKNPLGADARLRYLLERYPDTDVAGRGLWVFGEAFADRGDLQRAGLAWASLVEQYPGHDLRPDAEERLAEVRRKSIEIPDSPLPALLETLGRPTEPVSGESDPVPSAPSTSGQNWS